MNKLKDFRDLINSEPDDVVICFFCRNFLKMSHKEIADSRGVNERTVYRYLAKLDEKKERIGFFDDMVRILEDY